MSHVECRMGGVGTGSSAVICYVYVNIVGSTVSSCVCRDYMYMYTYLINTQYATYINVVSIVIVGSLI